jgi:hypothetical protein
MLSFHHRSLSLTLPRKRASGARPSRCSLRLRARMLSSAPLDSALRASLVAGHRGPNRVVSRASVSQPRGTAVAVALSRPLLRPAWKFGKASRFSGRVSKSLPDHGISYSDFMPRRFGADKVPGRQCAGAGPARSLSSLAALDSRVRLSGPHVCSVGHGAGRDRAHDLSLRVGFGTPWSSNWSRDCIATAYP